MNMESEIWMFRTRSGDYRSNVDSDYDSGTADNLLKENIQNIKNAVLEGADIKGTSFFGKTHNANLHLQHAPTFAQIQQSKSRKWFGSCTSSNSSAAASSTENNIELTGGSAAGVTARPSVAGGATAAGARAGGYTAAALAPPPTSVPPAINMNSERDDSSDGGSGNDSEGVLRAPVLRVNSTTGTTIDDLLSWLGTRYVSSNGNLGPKDSHYLPVLPNNYVQFRIEKALKFYKKRIPLCNRTRHIGQFLATAGSLASVLLAFLNQVEYTVITSIGTTGVMAWLEFQGTNNKINRYSSVVDALQKHIMWWKTSPPIEKSATENIDRLVVTCEEILKDEMNAWRSSSASQTKLLDKQTGADKGNNEV